MFCFILLSVIFVGVLFYFLCFQKKENLSPSNKTKLIDQPQEIEEYPQLFLFHADWCGHCQKLMPTWNVVKAELKGRIKVLNLESKDERMKNYGIKGFPTIRVYNSPQSFKEYSGNRTKEDIVSFALSSNI